MSFGKLKKIIKKNCEEILYKSKLKPGGKLPRLAGMKFNFLV